MQLSIILLISIFREHRTVFPITFQSFLEIIHLSFQKSILPSKLLTQLIELSILVFLPFIIGSSLFIYRFIVAILVLFFLNETILSIVSHKLNDKNIRFILIRAMPKKTKLDVKQKIALTFILEHIWSHKKSGPFRYPVDYVKMNILDYPSIIQKPMDLSTVMKKLKQYAYLFVEDCLEEIDLIWENCLKYNRPTDWISKSAKELQDHQKKLIKNYLFQIYERKYRKKKYNNKNQCDRREQNHQNEIKDKIVANEFQSNKIERQSEQKQLNKASLSEFPHNKESSNTSFPRNEMNPLNYLNLNNKFNNIFNPSEQYNKDLRQEFLNILKSCNDCEVSLSFMMIKRRCIQCIQYDNFGNATINLEKVDDFTLELAKNQLLSWNREDQLLNYAE